MKHFLLPLIFIGLKLTGCTTLPTREAAATNLTGACRAAFTYSRFDGEREGTLFQGKRGYQYFSEIQQYKVFVVGVDKDGKQMCAWYTAGKLTDTTIDSVKALALAGCHSSGGQACVIYAIGDATVVYDKVAHEELISRLRDRRNNNDNSNPARSQPQNNLSISITRRDPADDATQLGEERFNIPTLRDLPWRERISRAVDFELKQWLSAGATGLEEIPLPTYPEALSLRQEQWESNKEFEERVEKARAERRQVIDKLQVDYRSKVETRNKRVAEYNKARQDREAGLAQKRRELILAGINTLAPKVTLASPAFNQQTGELTITAGVDGLDGQTFAFSNTPQAFRRAALTEPGALRSTPHFQVSDAGEISLQALTVEAGGAAARGTPTTGISASAPLATVTIPQNTAPAIAQQSAIAVDRQQVEQILYRDENEMLRRRLEEQRRQQEQTLAAEQARASAEIARLRAEAEALRKQPGDQRPPVTYATGLDAHAIVIGNSAYPGSGRLDNPVNDAKAMSAKLRSLGIKVTEVNNANRDQMVRQLSEFTKTASKADLTLLFYAGHGVQIAGVNYMIPVDANLNDAAQTPLQAVSLTQVVEQYLPGKTKLVFLDACRDNPLMASGARGVSRGLAPINVSQGTLIAYATRDGQTADDGTGQANSPFTSALLEHLADPDDIAVILRTVRAKVMQRTNNRQQPWEYGSLTGGALVLSAIKR